MKNKTIILLAFILLGFATVPNLVNAQFITIPDECSSYGSWDQSTKTCTLNQDMDRGQDQGIEIKADNTVLDCNGHSIAGNPNFNAANTGISFSSGKGMVVENCSINGFFYGVYFSPDDSYGVLKNSSISGNAIGIWLSGSQNNTIVDNSVVFSSHANITFSPFSNSNTIAHNTISGSRYDYGIWVGTSDNNIFSSNNIFDNPGGGIFLGTSSSNVITNNTINHNGYGVSDRTGISLENTSSNNKVYHNNVINNGDSRGHNNKPNVSIDSFFNSFDDGYPSGGNYWSDYSGIDVKSGVNQDQINSDGTGDTPYAFLYGQDHYPFMAQNSWSSLTPVLIVPGLLGTEMKKGDELLWADINKMVNPLNSDNFMDPLAFNANLTPTDSTVSISTVITTKSFLGYTFDYIDGLITEFKNQGYAENENLFTFSYDWRYGASGKFVDGTSNVDLLAKKIQDVMQQARSSKVDIVAHSLGGLIVKQYVINHPLDNHIGKAVFVGVPNTGAPKAVKILLQGDNFGVLGLNDQEMKKVAANMPAAYDLLPTQQYYDTKGSYIEAIDNTQCANDSTVSCDVKDLNYQESNDFLTGQGFNASAISNAVNLQTQSFDNFDLRTTGINLYAIDGCKAATLSKVIYTKYNDIFGAQVSYDRRLAPGDNTVPLESATNLPINQNNKYYALISDHGKMPSQNGIRQEIVNIISGSNLSMPSAYGESIITQDITKCQLNGKAISVYSPVTIFATDQNGNRLGLADDGSVINEIPNADFEVLGDHKFMYLPQDGNQVYAITMQGTGTGTYTIKSQDIRNSQITKAEMFSTLPVTSTLTGQININPNDNTVTLSVKPNPSDTPQTIFPTKVLDFSTDKTPPESAIQFSPSKKDLIFAGIDNLSDTPFISVNDNGNAVILQDEAGNTTELDFKERNRKSALSAQILSMKYNGALVDMSRNLLAYSWSFDASGKLAKLSQKVKSRNNYSITAVYDGTTTKLTGTDSTGKIAQSFTGLKIIKVTTNKGDLQWSY